MAPSSASATADPRAFSPVATANRAEYCARSEIEGIRGRAAGQERAGATRLALGRTRVHSTASTAGAEG